MLVLAVAALVLVRQVDHVLRADSSGWPLTGDLTWLTASLLVYPALLAGLLLCSAGDRGSGRPWPRSCSGGCRCRTCSG